LKHLEIAYGIFDEYYIMSAVVKQGWKLALVFGVGQGDRYGT
jgi:hypothetical protein